MMGIFTQVIQVKHFAKRNIAWPRPQLKSSDYTNSALIITAPLCVYFPYFTHNPGSFKFLGL